MTDKTGIELTHSVRAHRPGRWARRATRLPLGAPIAYRSTATNQWAYGSMVDISRTGVLFVPDEDAVPDPDLRLVIFLSRAALEAGGVSGLWPDLYCAGPVTRTARTSGGRPVVAIRFDYERIVPLTDDMLELAFVADARAH